MSQVAFSPDPEGRYLATVMDTAGAWVTEYLPEQNRLRDLTIRVYDADRKLVYTSPTINAGNAIQRVHGRTKQAVESVSQAGPRYMLGFRYKFE